MSDPTTDKRLNDVLSQAKALRFAAAHGAIDYKEAKSRADKLLEVVNDAGRKIAEKYKRRYRKIKFSDL